MIAHSFCTIKVTIEVVRQWRPQLPRFPIVHSFKKKNKSLSCVTTAMFNGKLSFRRSKNINKFRLKKWEEEESGFRKMSKHSDASFLMKCFTSEMPKHFVLTFSK